MGTEIERKFLVRGAQWKEGIHGVLFRQGYLPTDDSRASVRVRIADENAWLTIKGPTEGIRRLEFETAIPRHDADGLLDALCRKPLIEKTRYKVEHCGHVWEVDDFHGANAGLVLAEVELQSENEAFDLPGWIGAEVSHDPRYFNAYLARHPYSTWSDDAAPDAIAKESA